MPVLLCDVTSQYAFEIDTHSYRCHCYFFKKFDVLGYKINAIVIIIVMTFVSN